MKRLALIVIFLVGLSGLTIKAAEGDKRIEEQGRKKIILGQKLENPYSVENLQNAFESFNRTTRNSQFQKRIVRASHKYIKISPSTEKHLIELEKIDAEGVLVLHDMPLDYEIIQEGDYFVNPKHEKDLFHPVYTVIPVNYSLPIGLPYEVLEQVYEPTEAEYEVETIALNAAGWRNEVDCTGSLVICDETNLSLDSTNANSERLFGRRYRPHGYVMVRNTETNQPQALRQAKISIGRGIWWRYTHTDDNGHFTSPKKYRGKVRIRAKWRSNIATVRKSWNELLGVQVSDHLMTIKRNTNGRTKHIEFGDDRLWYKGTVHNALVKYNDYALNNGINKPIVNANVWVWKNGDDVGATPMLFKYRHLASIATVAGIGQSNLWDVLVNAIAAFAIDLLPSRLHPDIIFSGLKGRNNTNGSVNTAEIEQRVFHEAAHYSHASQAGAWNWARLFASELSNSILEGDSYVDGSEPSFTAARQISLAEGWATVVEYKAMDDLYERSVDGNNMWVTDTEAHIDNFDMFSVPYSFGRTEQFSWFLHGLFWDIVDLPESATSDYRNGTTGSNLNDINDPLFINSSSELYPIFRYLRSDVYTACDFGTKLVAGYPAQGPDIEDLFHSYGFTCVDGGTGIVLPSVPSNFSITNYSNGNNHLNWSAVIGATQYKIYSSSSYSGTYNHAATRTAPTTSWSTYVANNLYFRVRACNSAGCGGFTSPRLARSANDDDCDYIQNQLRSSGRDKFISIGDCPIQ